MNFYTMNYWMVKSEPTVYSFDQLVTDKYTVWDGIRSYAARLHLKAMKKGDTVLFYHSNVGKEIIGIAKVSKEHFPDPAPDAEEWVAIELMPFKKLNKAVTLEQVKNEKRLQKIALITIPRLSVLPLKKEEFETILVMGS